VIPLPNKKPAVAGWVIWKTKFRDFVAIKDYESGEGKFECKSSFICDDYNLIINAGKLVKLKLEN